MAELVSGRPTPLMALEEITWVAYYRIQPFGDYRADVRSAQIAQILFNTNAKKGKAKKLQDFMPFFRKEPKPQKDAAKTIRSNFSNWIELQKKRGR